MVFLAFKRLMLGLVLMNKDIKVNVAKTLNINPNAFFEGDVTALGNGAMILFKKRFIGRKVYIIVRDEEPCKS